MSPERYKRGDKAVSPAYDLIAVTVTEISRTQLIPTTEDDIRLVRKELETVLATHHFGSSKRYPAFLSYVVEKALTGQASDLKERTLGVEVFQRRPDYDTNTDTIVRFSAGEVRKRLALVYHESTVDHTVQIVLPAGSYAPEFYLTAAGHSQPVPAPEAAQIAPIRPEDESHSIHAGGRRWRKWLTVPGLACAILLAWFLHEHFRPAAIDRFWQPMLTTQAPVLISPGAMVFSPELASVTRADRTVDYPYMSFATASSLTDLVTMLARNKNRYVVVPSSTLTLTEIRGRPVVLLGAYNNDWSLRALSDLRFRFTPQTALTIYDSTNPKVNWTRPVSSVPYSEADDYAIVARFHSRLTESPILVLAGIGKNGTEAATQFVTDPRYLSSLEPSLPKDWSAKDIEIVIKTRVIDGKTGEPTIEAVHVW